MFSSWTRSHFAVSAAALILLTLISLGRCQHYDDGVREQFGYEGNYDAYGSSGPGKLVVPPGNHDTYGSSGPGDVGTGQLVVPGNYDGDDDTYGNSGPGNMGMGQPVGHGNYDGDDGTYGPSGPGNMDMGQPDGPENYDGYRPFGSGPGNIGMGHPDGPGKYGGYRPPGSGPGTMGMGQSVGPGGNYDSYGPFGQDNMGIGGHFMGPGRICHAAPGEYMALRGIDEWCRDNCNRGYCPPSHCICN